MTIQTRLAKLEGIYNARSEKLQQAKEYAIKVFGVDDPELLRPLLEKIQVLEKELRGVIEEANEFSEWCVGQLENRQRLTPKDIEKVERYKNQIQAIQLKIREEISNCAGGEQASKEDTKLTDSAINPNASAISNFDSLSSHDPCVL
ncbi:hypothetical protein [Alteromonas antoniana]|uniref:hypothetical protein n=1 Tax=Alteromonas antoniana TaxID=2803813 RepID=UPI001C4599CB|nr:hypothetical protein [Alteromonas antoniana]